MNPHHGKPKQIYAKFSKICGQRLVTLSNERLMALCDINSMPVCSISNQDFLEVVYYQKLTMKNGNQRDERLIQRFTKGLHKLLLYTMLL